MSDGIGHKKKKKSESVCKCDFGFQEAFTEGFDAIKVLDNTNVYGVIFSEGTSNIFISSMWQKVLNPYTLVMSGGNKMLVGNCITLMGLTRAFFGVVAGQFVIDKCGVDTTFAVAGIVGIVGMLINTLCLLQNSELGVPSAPVGNSTLNAATTPSPQEQAHYGGAITYIYFMNVVWAIFSGLWNSAMETEWARSLHQQKREDANNARQVLNKLTTAFGPIFSIALFYYCGGTKWTVETLTFVMICGTALTAIPVLLCFTFSRWYEVRQEAHLCEINEIHLADQSKIVVGDLTKDSFHSVDVRKRVKDESRPGLLRQDSIKSKLPDDVRKAYVQQKIRITYPLGPTSQYGKLRILTRHLGETKYILGKEVMASLCKPPPVTFYAGSKESVASDTLARRKMHEDTAHGVVNLNKPVILCFHDRSRAPVAAVIDEVVVYLDEDRCVDTENSWLTFSVTPNFAKQKMPESACYCLHGLRKVVLHKQHRYESRDLSALTEQLLPDVQEGGRSTMRGSSHSRARASGKSGGPAHEESKINMAMANTIVLCDVMNAVGSGMSLKFMDLFLITDYGVTPVELMCIAIVQNLAVVFLTPTVKNLMKKMRKMNLKGSIGVSFVWALSLFFLALICVPNQNFYVSVVSIVLMNSLSSCTKAYNRAKLVNSLPHNRVAKYMVWDSLNKANQGGIAVFGGQIAHIWGYRGCFVVTFFILLLRWIVWTGYLMMRGCKRKHSQTVVGPLDADDEELPGAQRRQDKQVSITTQADIYDTVDRADFDPNEVGSELFPKRSTSEMFDTNQDIRYTTGRLAPEVAVLDGEEEDEEGIAY